MNTPPNPGYWLHLADLALLVAVVTAIALAWRRPLHWPVAVYLVMVGLADLIRRGLAAGPLAQPGPYTGLTRLAFHLEEALWFVGPFALAGLAVIVWWRRSPLRVAQLYLVAVAVLAIGYPTIRGDLLRRVYLAVELGALAVCVAALVHQVWRRERPALAQVVAGLMVLGDFLTLAGAWRGDLFTTWPQAWPVHALLYLAVSVVQGGAWLAMRRSG